MNWTTHFPAGNPGFSILVPEGMSMSGREPDPRTLRFAGDMDERDQPLPMTPEVLRGRAEKWP
jgi:hypothetical protein